jgi:hypothetical protein
MRMRSRTREGWAAVEALVYRGYGVLFSQPDPEKIEYKAVALYGGKPVAEASGHDPIEAVLGLADELGVEY